VDRVIFAFVGVSLSDAKVMGGEYLNECFSKVCTLQFTSVDPLLCTCQKSKSFMCVCIYI